MTIKISVNIGGVEFKNPVTVASGTFGYAEKYYDLEEVKKLVNQLGMFSLLKCGIDMAVKKALTC